MEVDLGGFEDGAFGEAEVAGDAGFEGVVAKVFGVEVAVGVLPEEVGRANGEGGVVDELDVERVAVTEFFDEFVAEVCPSAVACDAGEEVEGVGACAVAVAQLAPSAAEGFLADGMAWAVFGDRKVFDFFDDEVAKFVEAVDA